MSNDSNDHVMTLAGPLENGKTILAPYDIFVLLLLMFIFDEDADWSHSKLCTK